LSFWRRIVLVSFTAQNLPSTEGALPFEYCGRPQTHSPQGIVSCELTAPLELYISTRSVLILWVEAFESNACIIRGKLPVNTGLFDIAFVLPRLRFLA
jgi:hypothetical protein